MKPFFWLALPALMIAGCGGSSSDRAPSPAPADTPVLSVATTGLVEGDAPVTVNVVYSDSADEARQVTLVFQAGTAAVADIILADTSLTVPAGKTSVTTQLSAVSDDLDEGTESFALALYESGVGREAHGVAFTIIDPDSRPSLSAQQREWPDTGVFAAAGGCADCHRASATGDSPAVMRSPHPDTPNQPDPHGEDISPFQGWDHSIMAHSVNDPYFRANVVHEMETFPQLAEFIEDTCTRCHAPMGRTHAHHTGSSLNKGDSCILDDGCYSLDAAMSEPHGREGVSCTACHQITDKGMNQVVDSGNYEIINTDNPQIFGPFQGPAGQAMQGNTQYTPVFSDHMHSSEHCRSCHDLETPTIDMHTNMPTGDVFPEQMPYTEWANSDYVDGGASEAHCQDCHMQSPGADFLTRIAVMPNGGVNSNWPERSPYYRHEMVGSNAWMLDILGEYREELGIDQVSTAQGFADKAAFTRDFLSGAASLSIANAALTGDTATFDVTITNHAGHKLPTSFPSRRVWLAATLRDANGRVLFENGHPDPVTHRLAVDAQYTSHECLEEHKADSFDSGQCYMPHVDVVTAEGDIPIYEPVLRATDGHITHILLYADGFLKDNRIPPAGFDASTAPEKVRPVGVAGDADFNVGNAGSDTVAYRLPLGGAPSTSLTVEATLYYQTVRPTFVDGLHGEHEFIEHFHAMAANHPPAAEVLATASVALP